MGVLFLFLFLENRYPMFPSLMDGNLSNVNSQSNMGSVMNMQISQPNSDMLPPMLPPTHYNSACGGMVGGGGGIGCYPPSVIDNGDASDAPITYNDHSFPPLGCGFSTPQFYIDETEEFNI